MPWRKFYSKWFKDFIVKSGTLNLLEGKVDNMCDWIDTEKNFQNRTSGVKTLRPTVDKLDPREIKMLLCNKGDQRRGSLQSRKKFAGYTSERGLVSNISKHQENNWNGSSRFALGFMVSPIMGSTRYVFPSREQALSPIRCLLVTPKT